MAAAIKAPWISLQSSTITSARASSPVPLRTTQLPDFAGVFRGRELTRKARRLASGIDALDALLDGGIARGRVSEIIGRAGTGRTSLAAAFAANATGRGEVIAWIDAAGAFDPASIAAAGVELARVLWASIPREASRMRPASSREGRVLKAAEMVLEAGGFGLIVIDFGDIFRAIPDSAVLRIARAAERSGAAVIAIAPRRICGTFAALSLTMNRAGASFSRIRPGAPALFDGLRLESVIARNKLGGSGAITRIVAAIDPQYCAQRVQINPLHPGEGNAASRRVGEGERATASNHPERPLPTGDARHPPRIGEGIRKNTDQNLERAPLRSATKGPSPDRVPVAPPLQGEELEPDAAVR